MNKISSGYYDEFGVYFTDSHYDLTIHVSDYYGDDAVDMYFDNVSVGINAFVGTNYGNGYIGRYRFARY
jgi:FlaG/FlaF family flagellin (archaellin)